MDNFSFDITAQGDDAFRQTLLLALQLKGSYKITHYAISDKGLAFFWHDPIDIAKNMQTQPLPFPMEKLAIVDFAVNWLATADYGKQPDHDGDNGKGWTIYNENWGHVFGSFYGVIAIKPTWAMYGK